MVHKKQIFVLDDVISEEFCNKLRSIIIETEGRQEKWGPGENVQCKYTTNHTKDIDDELFKIVGDIIVKIRKANPDIRINSDSSYQLREIYGETRLHTDGILPDPGPAAPRSLSLIIALNDDYEGGELYFPNQEYKIKLKRGQAIAFPPYWTHPHGANPPLNGTFRYTINTWLLE